MHAGIRGSRDTAARDLSCRKANTAVGSRVFVDAQPRQRRGPAMVLSATVDFNGGLLDTYIYPGYNPRLHSPQELRNKWGRKKKERKTDIYTRIHEISWSLFKSWLCHTAARPAGVRYIDNIRTHILYTYTVRFIIS